MKLIEILLKDCWLYYHVKARRVPIYYKQLPDYYSLFLFFHTYLTLTFCVETMSL